MRKAILTIGHVALKRRNGARGIAYVVGIVSIAVLLSATAGFADAKVGVITVAPPTLQLPGLLADSLSPIRIEPPIGDERIGVIWFGGTETPPGSTFAWRGPR